MLRWALREAAMGAARPTSPDHAYYLQVRTRLGGKRAALSVARKATPCAPSATRRWRRSWPLPLRCLILRHPSPASRPVLLAALRALRLDPDSIRRAQPSTKEQLQHHIPS